MKSKLYILLMAMILITQYQNCSKTNFEGVKALEKAQALDENLIFPENPDIAEEQPIIDDPVIEQPIVDNPIVDNPVTTTTVPKPADKPLRIPASTMCSNDRTSKAGTNAMATDALKLQLIEKTFKLGSGVSEVIVCEETDGEKIVREINSNKKLLFSNCPVPDGDYDVRLLAKRSIQINPGRTLAGVQSEDWVEILNVDDKAQSEPLKIKDGKASASFQVLMDYNQNNKSQLYAGANCDKNASPLYIDLRRDASDMDILSSPETGVWFDIMGANAPVPYQKIRISWFEKGKFAMLALPNARGEVLGIDQLFGDNTKGPDGGFAANGFLALAKFDLNKDQVIDAKDAVFKKLRLWHDYNRDGVADKKKELSPLGSEDIISIDLKYDPNYYERDKYGNEIKYKSVVYRSKGKPKPIFDVWFAIK